ncbi:pyridoxamine 5'-phosphate oxidase family protein [Agaribacterium haliotis]|uniref:pyridoxamine 5'-phosphate oxidase family protein n=1 Tax=Agaribacterium haliotis TaxID=2013869 RepID=UPI000BB5789F|nr:pyridoxamine 5'-phosphate oxidase family protein [Agaribacterium haliotis]
MILGFREKSAIKASRLCWLVTVDEHGAQHCLPKARFSYFGDNQLLIADLAISECVDNLADNPRVCVSFADVHKRHGYKFTGLAEFVMFGSERLRRQQRVFAASLGSSIARMGLIVVTLDSATEIQAPSYLLYPETLETEKIAEILRSYGL